MASEDQTLLPKFSDAKLTETEIETKKYALYVFSVLVHVVQAIFIIFFGVFASEGSVLDSSDVKDFNVGYQMFTGVLLMLVIGFGYLMTFLSHYSLGSVGFCLLVTAITFQWALFTEAFFTQLFSLSFGYMSMNIYDMINSLYAVAAVLISFGGVIGKTTPTQLLIMVLVELVFYSINNRIFATGFFDIADCGGTIVIHMFGAYFGLAVSWMMRLPKTEVKESYTSDIFSLIGTMILWAYWNHDFVGLLAEFCGGLS